MVTPNEGYWYQFLKGIHQLAWVMFFLSPHVGFSVKKFMQGFHLVLN